MQDLGGSITAENVRLPTELNQQCVPHINTYMCMVGSVMRLPFTYQRQPGSQAGSRYGGQHATPTDMICITKRGCHGSALWFELTMTS